MIAKFKHTSASVFLIFTLTCTLPGLAPVSAEDFYCEVMAMTGDVTLTNSIVVQKKVDEGDLLRKGDTVHVSGASYVDLAYDREWNNITRIQENSTVEIRSIFPTDLNMLEGDIFAKLDNLPADSTFEISTPTAIAAVRGSKYRTAHREGVTRVYNFSQKSPVYVFGKDKIGDIHKEPVLVRPAEKTSIRNTGAKPGAPEHMNEQDLAAGLGSTQDIANAVKSTHESGRIGKTPPQAQIKDRYEKSLTTRIKAMEQAMHQGDQTRAGMKADDKGDRKVIHKDKDKKKPGGKQNRIDKQKKKLRKIVDRSGTKGGGGNKGRRQDRKSEQERKKEDIINQVIGTP